MVIAASALSGVTAGRAEAVATSRQCCTFWTWIGRWILVRARLEAGGEINAVANLALWELGRTQARIAYSGHFAHAGPDLLRSTNSLEIREEERRNSGTKRG